MYRIGQEELEEIGKVIASRKLFMVGDPAAGHQQEVVRFEREWAEKLGVKHALCLSGGGSAALLCGLAALGVGPGDEVIVPAYTFMASASAVLAAGAIPVIAEVDESCLLDAADVERKMGPKVKAIIPVHMVGMPCDMDAILAVARKHGVRVVEDSCQCDGGSYKGRRTGSIGDMGAFSFNDFKIMTCGEGGSVVTSDRALYERALVFSDSGTVFRPYAKDLAVAPFLGLQFRPSEIQGAILRIQLQRLDGMLGDLRRVKARMTAELKGKPGIRFAPSHDPAGDCGVVIAFQFADTARATAFSKAEGVGGWLPINTGKHVYYNWTPIFEKRVGHHPDANPFNHPKNRGLRTEYHRDMCPKTTDILGRTVFVSLNPDWTGEQVAARIAACEKAGRLVVAS
jgi:dTDP-4-amino-4,6-dideoxygalactose transaminase